MTARTILRAAWRYSLGMPADMLQHWPWLETLRTLRARFREDHLSLTASSLTFTTLIALVPLVTVMLAAFSAFPIFAKFQGALDQYFLQMLVPDKIAKPVLGSLNQFAAQSKRLGGLGLVVLTITALAMMFTIDRALNTIWRVRRARPIAQRVLVYWAGLTLGPLVLGMSLSITSYAISASRGLVGAMPDAVSSVLNALEFALLTGAVAAMFHYVPNTHVRWRHAFGGGLFVSCGFEVAKRGLAWYVDTVPTFTTLYGAFATLPIFLLWLYIGWVIVLLGAVMAAYAPSLSMKLVHRSQRPGHGFGLALAVVRVLADAKAGRRRGLTLLEVAEALATDPLQIEPLLDALVTLDWAARLDEDGAQRHVLLADPASTPVLPLVDELLVEPSAETAGFRDRTGLARLTLADVL